MTTMAHEAYLLSSKSLNCLHNCQMNHVFLEGPFHRSCLSIKSNATELYGIMLPLETKVDEKNVVGENYTINIGFFRSLYEFLYFRIIFNIFVLN